MLVKLATWHGEMIFLTIFINQLVEKLRPRHIIHEMQKPIRASFIMFKFEQD